MENWRRTFIVVIGFLEAIVFSGILFGWTSLVHILQQEGVYSNLCAAENHTTTNIFHSGRNATIVSFRLTTMIPALDENYTTSDTQSVTNFQHSIFEPYINFGLKNGSIIADFFQDLEGEDGVPKFTLCNAQSKQFGLVYTIAGIMFGLTSIVIGFSLDIFGLWFTRFLGSFMTTAGLIILAFTNKDQSWFLWPALILIALGTNQLRLSSFQFANLYPERRSTIMLAYGAGYSFSTAVFLIVQLCYHAGAPYTFMILTLAAISLLTFPVTLLMPKMRINDHVAKDSNRRLEKDDNTTMKRSSKGNDLEADNMPPPSGISIAQKKIPLRESLLTISSGLHLFWHFINMFNIFYFSVAFNSWAYKTTDSSDDVAFYNKVSGISAIIAPLFIPFAGLITDSLMARASKLDDPMEKLVAQFEAPAYVVLVTTIFSVSVSIFTMFTTSWAIYVSLVAASILRPLLVGSLAVYVRLRFFSEHFNRLNGIFTTVISALTLVQYPFFVWMFSSDAAFFQSHGLLMILVVMSAASPIHVMFKCVTRKFAKNHIQVMQQLEASTTPT